MGWKGAALCRAAAWEPARTYVLRLPCHETVRSRHRLSLIEKEEMGGPEKRRKGAKKKALRTQELVYEKIGGKEEVSLLLWASWTSRTTGKLGERRRRLVRHE